jgi:hypothetical protein
MGNTLGKWRILKKNVGQPLLSFWRFFYQLGLDSSCTPL